MRKQVPSKSCPSQWRTSHPNAADRAHIESAQTDNENRKAIQKSLNADRETIRSTRRAVSEKLGFDLLDTSEQERQLEEVALTKVQRRIDEGLYVSCKYPEFAGYIPPIAYGKTGQTKDPVRHACFSRQLEALRREPASDDDDDDEEDVPPFKTEENNTKQKKMSEFLQFVGDHETRLSKDNGEPEHEDGGDKDKVDKTATAGRRSQGRKSAPHTLKRKRVDESNGNKKEVITWRVVSRGEPLPPGSPAVNFEPRKPKINPWLGRVVFRGQIMAENGKDED
jgi:hypothetical protein